MKKATFFLLFYICSANILAQNQSWLTGCGNKFTEHIVIDFAKNTNQFPPYIRLWDAKKYSQYSVKTNFNNNVLSDTLGNIKISYDGAFVKALPYPDTSVFNSSNGYFSYYSIEQSPTQGSVNTILKDLRIVLPHHTKPNQYLVISLDTSFSEKGRTLFYSLVDVTNPYNANNQPQILIKRKVISKGAFEQGGVRVCKHANGKDWWLLLGEQSPDKKLVINRFIIKENEIVADGVQKTNYTTILNQPFVSLQTVYSPDGKYIARYQYVRGRFRYEIFKFDRCKGEIDTKSVKQIISDSLSQNFDGCVKFSPNSKLVYISTGAQLSQYELETWEETILGKKEIFLADCRYGNCDYQGLELGPDNRIYMISKGKKSFSVIFDPDKKGKSCNFIEDTLKLPATMCSGVLPNHPNYKLGKTECFIAAKDLHNMLSLKLSPNPGKDYINVDSNIDIPDNTVLIFNDILGREIYRVPYQSFIDCSHWAEGLYTYQLLQGNRLLANGKWIKD